MDRNLSYPAWEVESAVQRNLGNKNDSHVLLLKLIVVVPPEESDAQSSAAEKCPNDRRAGYRCAVHCFVMVKPAEKGKLKKLTS